MMVGITLSQNINCNADVNGDGKLGAAHTIFVLQRIAGLKDIPYACPLPDLTVRTRRPLHNRNRIAPQGAYPGPLEFDSGRPTGI